MRLGMEAPNVSASRMHFVPKISDMKFSVGNQIRIPEMCEGTNREEL